MMSRDSRGFVAVACWLALSAGFRVIAAPMAFPDAGAWGVTVHSPFHDGLKQIGVQWARTDFRWSEMEKDRRGSYDWSRADRLVSFYKGQQRMRVLGVLTLEDAAKPYTGDMANKPLVIDAIVRWADAVARRYKGKVAAWEIGNEPETFPMNGYWNDPATYTRMARCVARAIKMADPHARVVAPSVAWVDCSFLRDVFRLGLLRDGTIDAVSYHGYHRWTLLPESGLAQDVEWIRGMAAAYAPKGKAVSVVDTERGYCIAPAGSPKDVDFWRNVTYSESEQAAYLARYALETMACGVEMAIWYKDMNGERDFSLYYGDEKDPRGLRPCGRVFRNLAALLPENPLRLVNNAYTVSVSGDAGGAGTGSAASQLVVRSFLQVRGAGPNRTQRLVVAAWNPVEAFDGQILESRCFAGTKVLEQWRTVLPTDEVLIPARVVVAGPGLAGCKAVQTYDVLANDPAHAPSPLAYGVAAGRIISAPLRIGPTPTVVTIDLAGPVASTAKRKQ